MASIITHSEKHRHHIATVTIDLVAREGLAAATIRRIAAEAQSSTTAITHYFNDKEELLVCAFEALSSEGEARFENAVRRDPADVVGALLTMVPWCPANVRRWKAYLAFWDEAARNADLASLIARSASTGTEQLCRLLEVRRMPAMRKVESCRLLNAIIQGLALQMLVEHGSWSERKVRDVLDQALELCTPRNPA